MFISNETKIIIFDSRQCVVIEDIINSIKEDILMSDIYFVVHIDITLDFLVDINDKQGHEGKYKFD